MSEDYLWNKTGEPDPEVKELEEILGVLRYQPKALMLPEEVAVRRRSYYPLLAIAATVALALLAAGLWFGLKSTSTSNPESAKKIEVSPAPAPSVDEKKTVEQQAAHNNTEQRQTSSIRKPRRHTPANPALLAQRRREREEAMAAKEQLLIALRLASEKLNQAQRKTQHPATQNQIRNQHKVG